MNKNTFEDIYKSVQGLEAGSSVSFNGFPMIVVEQTATLNRYYGELRWINQLDGRLNIDVTLRVGINFNSEVARLNAEVERLTDEVGLMNQLWEKYLTPEIRKAMVKAVKKGQL